jgi:hypothetical protein
VGSETKRADFGKATARNPLDELTKGSSTTACCAAETRFEISALVVWASSSRA